MNVSLIIAAGGAGRRFLKGRKKGPLSSKVFFNLGAKPVLLHALESFRGIPEIREVLIALPEKVLEKKRGQAPFEKEGPGPFCVRLVAGGKTRAESVWNALRRSSPRNEWVLVHDGARPFPPKEAILKLLRGSKDGHPLAPTHQVPPLGAEIRTPDAFLLARPVVPTLKRVSSQKGEVLETVERNGLFEAETPQLVRRSFLLKAYRENPKAFQATDESSLVEQAGGKAVVVSHSGWNPKITTPEDLHLAEAYYFRGGGIHVGFGRDTHRLVEGRKFYLGGIRIPFEKGALGHSDGDALLHAILDGLLGALGLGDIGEWFPERDPRFKNIRSAKMVKKILGEIKARGFAPERVDTVILLEKPRLGPHKKKMKSQIGYLLGLPPQAISVKAKTLEGLGPEGEGKAVTCEALVTVRKSEA